MKVLVDTCVWSQLLRKAVDDSDPVVSELKELIKEFQVQMIGPRSAKSFYPASKARISLHSLKSIFEALPILK